MARKDVTWSGGNQWGKQNQVRRDLGWLWHEMDGENFLISYYSYHYHSTSTPYPYQFFINQIAMHSNAGGNRNSLLVCIEEAIIHCFVVWGGVLLSLDRPQGVQVGTVLSLKATINSMMIMVTCYATGNLSWECRRHVTRQLTISAKFCQQGDVVTLTYFFLLPRKKMSGNDNIS